MRTKRSQDIIFERNCVSEECYKKTYNSLKIDYLSYMLGDWNR